MKLAQATEADADRLKIFFENQVLPGAIDVKVSRPTGFFDHYRLISNDFETLMLTDEKDDIKGVATLVFREGFVLGQKQTWALAKDLRIAPTRQAIAQWSQFFLPLLERINYERGCRYIFSAVEHTDNQAYNALVRPTSHTRRRLPRYLLANRFRLISIHGRLPFANKPLESIKLKELSASDIEPMCAYLREQAKLRPLATMHTPETFLHEVARWPGLSLSDFRIAIDSKGRIRGCAALYDGRPVQSIIPMRYDGFAQTLHQTMWLASFSGLVRSTPIPGRPAPIRYMSHISCDNGEVFHRLVDDAYSRLGPKELLTYLHFRGNWSTLPPLSFVATSLPFGLYLILPPNSETPPWPTPSIRSLAPEFEAAWI